MPKLIDYPRTSYTGAWEVSEVVDDTGGKCALETTARKLNRKVSGSFKAIVGSAVKFGLLTSKREMLTTTTLFRRIKHAYDKQEELLFHREAFLTPPLFSQLCRKFRSRELPVAMLDVLLIREFEVEEINAQVVAKAFVDGARMVGLLDEHNIMADIDRLASQQAPRRELANPLPAPNTFRPTNNIPVPTASTDTELAENAGMEIADNTKSLRDTKADNPIASTRPAQRAPVQTANGLLLPASRPAPTGTSDAIANLFNLKEDDTQRAEQSNQRKTTRPVEEKALGSSPTPEANPVLSIASQATKATADTLLFQLQLIGPGMNTTLDVVDADDLSLVRALLDKIERQLRRG